MHRLTSLFFPRVVQFEFKISNGQMIKLSFPSNTKICDFVKDVEEKAILGFSLSKNQTIEIVEVIDSQEHYITLDVNDETPLYEKYANNYKQVSFHISCNLSI